MRWSELRRPLLLAWIFVIAWHGVGGQNFLRVCYFTNWGLHRPALGRYSVANYTDPHMCSHIIYAFANIVPDSDNLEASDPTDEGDRGGFKRITDLKRLNPELKVLLAIGGIGQGSEGFTHLVRDDKKIERFSDNVVRFLRHRNFDGLDVDWEYPGQWSSPASDKYRYTALIRILAERFQEEQRLAGGNRLLLTAAVPASHYQIEAGYEIETIMRHLDFINLMTYDFHGIWEDVIGHHSALYGREGESRESSLLNTDFAVKHWISRGAPRHKIAMGVPTYGRAFRLFNSSLVHMGDRHGGDPPVGAVLGENGVYAIYEVCQYLKGGWTERWHDQHKVPFAFSNEALVGFDNIRSVELKANYIKDNRLGGFMIWELGMDDFGGRFCDAGPYPIVSTLNRMLDSARDQCLPGQYGFSARRGCMPCPRGSFQPLPFQTRCLPCRTGYTTSRTGTIHEYLCIEECPSGTTFYYANATCAPCPLGFYRKNGETTFCRKCPPNQTTVSRGSSACVPRPEYVRTPRVENTRITLSLEFLTRACENQPVLFGAIEQLVSRYLQNLSASWPRLCDTACRNARLATFIGCRPRVKRQADVDPINSTAPSQNSILTIQLIVDNVPSELSHSESKEIRLTENMLAEAFYDRTPMDPLGQYGISYRGIGGAISRLVCTEPGTVPRDTSCEPCSAGTYHDGDETCIPCPMGFYQDLPAQNFCKECNGVRTTRGHGSTHMGACVSPCEVGIPQCQNNGTCLWNEELDILGCDCKPGFEGNTCEIPLVLSSTALVVGIVVGVTLLVIVVALVIVIACICCKRRQRDKRIKANRNWTVRHLPPPVPLPRKTVERPLRYSDIVNYYTWLNGLPSQEHAKRKAIAIPEPTPMREVR